LITVIINNFISLQLDSTIPIIMNQQFEYTKKLTPELFEQLFNDLYPALCRHSLQLVRISEIAEEIVQEQFVYLWERRDTIHVHTSYKAYLYAAVKNKSIDYLKSKFANLQFVSEELIYDLPTSSNPLQQLEENELESMVTKVLKSLPEKCYAIFSLSRYGGLTNKQIAENLNISEKTVENQITIALKKIKSQLEKYLAIFILGNMM
jgi:RNA polymerase sigma-70 factor, ECF subfamily